MTARSIPIALPFIGETELEAVLEPLRRGWLTQGPAVAEFERAFAERHRVAHALATTSCTTALELALAVLGVGPGDEVVVPAFTWVATANVVRLRGATPVFVDVDRSTYNLDVRLLGAALSSKTKAVIPVHLFGLCAEVDAVRETIGPSVAIVEDAACAVGAECAGRPAGTLGDLAAFSFHPRKIVTTGEGGMLTTADDQLAASAERLRNHGASLPEEVRHTGPQPFLLPDFDEVGYNLRMTDLQGAVGVAQLGRLDALLAERREWAAWYQEQLAGIPWLTCPKSPEAYLHSWQSFVVRVDQSRSPAPRNELMARLHDLGVSTRPGTHAVPTLGAYRQTAEICPVAAELQDTTMAIPLHNRMNADDYAYVVEAIRGL